TRAPGYVLRAAREEVDLERFEALAESARDTADPARRAELLHQALSLWRGAALSEFRQEPFAGPAARRLRELRLSALEQRAEAGAPGAGEGDPPPRRAARRPGAGSRAGVRSGLRRLRRYVAERAARPPLHRRPRAHPGRARRGRRRAARAVGEARDGQGGAP